LGLCVLDCATSVVVDMFTLSVHKDTSKAQIRVRLDTTN
jgi:hypothetical protein